MCLVLLSHGVSVILKIVSYCCYSILLLLGVCVFGRRVPSCKDPCWHMNRLDKQPRSKLPPNIRQSLNKLRFLLCLCQFKLWLLLIALEYSPKGGGQICAEQNRVPGQMVCVPLCCCMINTIFNCTWGMCVFTVMLCKVPLYVS